MRCWAANYCKRADSGACNELCEAYVLLKALYSQSNMLTRYQYDIDISVSAKDPDYKAYLFLNEFKENIESHVEQGEGLFIWGRECGTGKTTWATKMLNFFFRKTVFKGGLEYQGYYLNVPTFLEQLRESYDNPTVEFERTKLMVVRSKLLVMDDIGSEKPSEWVSERLYTIINQRDGDGLSTIYTSNLSLDEIAIKVGERAASRIKGHTTLVQLKGKDRRGLD